MILVFLWVHSVWQSLGPSMLLQMKLFFFYGWIIFNSLYIPHLYTFVNGHLYCFQILAIMTSASMNIVVHISWWITLLSKYMPLGEIGGSYVNSGFFFFSFLRNLHTVFPVSTPTYIWEYFLTHTHMSQTHIRKYDSFFIEV